MINYNEVGCIEYVVEDSHKWHLRVYPVAYGSPMLSALDVNELLADCDLDLGAEGLVEFDGHEYGYEFFELESMTAANPACTEGMAVQNG